MIQNSLSKAVSDVCSATKHKNRHGPDPGTANDPINLLKFKKKKEIKLKK